MNGMLSVLFQSSMGIRQGDPLFPYLFVIAMEVLSCLLRKVMEYGFLTACEVRGGETRGLIYHICIFGDNTLILFRAFRDQTMYLCWLAMWFGAILG